MKNLIWTLVFFVVILSTGCKKDNAIVDTQPEYNPDNWYWVKSMASPKYTSCKKIKTDNSGNIYITGVFSWIMTVGDSSLLSNGETDVFITKFYPSGELAWIKQSNGPGGEYVGSLCSDGAGNVYVVGSFYGSVNFSNKSIVSSGANDVFIVKYDKDGNLVWLKQLGGEGGKIGNAICVDAAGSVYVGGSTLGTLKLDGTKKSILGYIDAFLAKYNSTGELLWIKQSEGSYAANVFDIAADNSGNIYFCGDYNNSIAFGGINLTSNGDLDCLIGKLDNAGNFQWIKKMGGTAMDYLNSIAVDKFGNSYATGGFCIDFSIENMHLIGKGDADVLVVKLNSNGNLQWIIQEGGKTDDVGRGIALDSKGNCIVCGFFSGNATFDSIPKQSFGKQDAFLIKLSSSGQFKGISQMGGPEDDYALSTCVDNSGYIYVCGNYVSSISFGSFITESVTPKSVFFLSASGMQNGFFGKLVINN